MRPQVVAAGWIDLTPNTFPSVLFLPQSSDEPLCQDDWESPTFTSHASLISGYPTPSNPKWLKLATFFPHKSTNRKLFFFFSMNSIVLTALLLLSLKQKNRTQSLTFFLSLGPSITWTATLFIPTASPLLAWVRHHWPFTFHLECSTNPPSTVFTSYQLFFTPVHLKTAEGCIFLKFSFAHVTLLFPSGLRVNCKTSLCIKAFRICHHPILLPWASPTLQPRGGSCWFPDSPRFPLCLTPDDTSSFNEFLPPCPFPQFFTSKSFASFKF